jgi:predicted negative regulator of RcsB-dependent stress response
MAALMMAKILFESGKPDDARARLEWVMNNTADDATRHVARLRLAGVHADLGNNEQAIAVLDVDDRTGFESSYYELEGDLMIKMGEKEKAREAYRKALEKAAPGSSFASMISIKLNDLGTEGS